MTARRLARLVALDFRRSWRRLAAAGVGVAMGVAALVFLMGLAFGLRSTLLDDVLPLDRLEVAAEATNLDLLGLRFGLGTDTLDDEMISRLEVLPGVGGVYPKMKLTVPAVASGGGSLLGSGIQTDLVADGIAAELVSDEVGEVFRFDGVETGVTCQSDRECGDQAYCSGGSAGRKGSCRRYVPVLVSPHLVELYNGSFRRAYRLPQIDPEAAIGFTFDMAFGASTLRPSGRRPPQRERMRLVGFSDRAIPLGVTLPLEFVRDVNVAFGSARAAGAYHSAIVRLETPRDAPAVLAAVEDMGLVVTDRGARRAADLMGLLVAILAVVGGAVLAVAAVSVAHATYITVSSRRREIAVLRALGASRRQVRGLFLTEAALVGAVAGALGVTVAVGAARVIDVMGRFWVPDFPFKPDSFFELDPWLLIGGVVLGVSACVLGAVWPTVTATAADPAEALTES